MQMVPVDSDDLWFAYNLIAPGDSIMAVTVRYSFSQFSFFILFSCNFLSLLVICYFVIIIIFCNCNRKVLREAANGGRDAERVKLKLEIKVEEVFFRHLTCVNRIFVIFYFLLWLILFCARLLIMIKKVLFYVFAERIF